ncbi:uncharacterized protein LOC134690811 isoform X1 [Mytilus trossulus]|uniref:uncharacterized protein LOC134690811 isoform X1 n=1 Tax=Mytilus trossulus TaxID=6551 RepID=UPI0030057177
MQTNIKFVLPCLFVGPFTYIVYMNFIPSSGDGNTKWNLFQYNKQDSSQRQLKHIKKNKANGDLTSKGDVDCIRAIEKFRNRDDTFFIPPDVELAALPNNVSDCLYQRIITTRQYFCANRSRHGSVKDGWNICMDGCYKPNNKTVIYVLSIVNDYENLQSIDLHYKINVIRHKPRMNGTDIYVNQKNKSNHGGQSIKLGTWSDAVKHGLNDQNILVIDVESLTESVVDHIMMSGVLNVIHQFSIRISYGDPVSGIDYLTALQQLRMIFEAGFRIYWSRPEWSCTIANKKDRTSCVYLYMVYHMCRDISKNNSKHQQVSENGYLSIQEDKMLRQLNNAKSDHPTHVVPVVLFMLLQTW